MPYLYVCLDNPIEWWDQHTVTYNGEAVSRIYGRRPTSMRLKNGMVYTDELLALKGKSLSVEIERNRPTEAEWEIYRGIVANRYPNQEVILATGYEHLNGSARLICASGQWGKLPSFINIMTTIYKTLDEIDAMPERPTPYIPW